MPNRLIHATSPYLRQHAHNPVDWYPWGPEAFAKARAEDKPIFLSIGYAACHWCHVMAHESFEDPEIAALLNEHFVSIKVDREERPDIDAIYMNAVVSMTGQGGWPLSVFLTPEGEPFYGGTYFPPEPRHGLPSFRQVLEGVLQAWREDRERIREIGRKAASHIAEGLTPLLEAEAALRPETTALAIAALAREYDTTHGGFHPPPKFPQAMLLTFLLAQAQRGESTAREMALHTLGAMARGGMYDLIGGGFHRYSTDTYWRVPHFEKMLYDNALLARAYLQAALLTDLAPLRRVAEHTLDFMLRELQQPTGGFASSLDADSEGGEGYFYTWTPTEVRQALNDERLTAAFLAAYDITPNGQIEGRSVPQRVLRDAEVAERFGFADAAAARAALEEAKRRLFAAREQRPRPALDDKILAGWNGLAIRALAEAAFHLRRPDYLQAALQAATFLRRHLWDGETLHRSWREGQVGPPGFLEDYATVALGALALYQTTGDLNWFHWAERLAQTAEARFYDPAQGAYYDTEAAHDTPLVRPRELQDNATPCGNSLMAELLLRLATFTGQNDRRRQAEALLASMQTLLTRWPTAFGHWLTVLDFALGPQTEVALLSPAATPPEELLAPLREGFWPRTVWAWSAAPPPEDAPALFLQRTAVEGKPTAYVCHGSVCSAPLTSPEALRRHLHTTSDTYPFA